MLLLAILLFGCQENAVKITDSKDYNSYLFTSNTPTKDALQEELEFWQKRFNNDSTRLLEMNRLSDIYIAMYEITGTISDLKTSEKLVDKSIDVSARNKDGYMRKLAQIYILQNRFKEAKILLDSAYTFPDNRNETEIMLFDVAIEFGDYKNADKFLGKIKNTKDINYLIRLAKWSHHNKNLDAAIKYLEQAVKIAEERGDKGLKIILYSKLGDYNGDFGRIHDAYNNYLKTLKLQYDNPYVKRQIAWIVYSYENNTKEANRILDSVMKNYKAPDFNLLKGEMAEYVGNQEEAEKQYDLFLKEARDPNYGNKYNFHLIKLYADRNPEMALKLAQKEVKNRATADAYHLLAYAQLKTGDSIEALKIIDNKVIGKTVAPSALYSAALIYKANGIDDKVLPLKEKLLGSFYELGPLMEKEIEKL